MLLSSNNRALSKKTPKQQKTKETAQNSDKDYETEDVLTVHFFNSKDMLTSNCHPPPPPIPKGVTD